MKKKNKKISNDLFVLIIGIFIFCIMLLFFSILIITKSISSIMLRNYVYIITSIVIAIIGFLLYIIMNKNRKYIVLNILSGVVFILILSYFYINLLRTNQVYKYQGNNIYNSLYVKSIGDKGYNSIDEGVKNILKEKYGENEYEELYCVSDENYTWIFQKSDFKIIELEFYNEGRKYYYEGSTVLTYDSTVTTSEYSDIETIRADVAHSIFYGMKEEDVIYPAWGVSEYNKIENVSINDVQIDFVEKLIDSNEKEYYFWIITNIGKIENIEDIEKIIINGM